MIELFMRAVEMLGQTREEKDGTASRIVPDLVVRLGGIHALERLAGDSEKDRPAIFEILFAYVRENSSWNDAKQQETDEAVARWKEKEGQGWLGVPSPRTDVRAALTVLGASFWNRAALPEAERPRIDLREADLRGADLARAHLEGARLDGAHLESAQFGSAHLERATLAKAHLQGAHFEGAYLEGAELWGADLEHANLAVAHLERARFARAHLEGADLEGAHLEGAALAETYLEGAFLRGAHLEGALFWRARLEGANLRRARFERTILQEAHLEGASLLAVEGLTQTQVDSAYGDETTQLAPGLTRPPHWGGKSGGAANPGGRSAADRTTSGPD